LAAVLVVTAVVGRCASAAAAAPTIAPAATSSSGPAISTIAIRRQRRQSFGVLSPGSGDGGQPATEADRVTLGAHYRVRTLAPASAGSIFSTFQWGGPQVAQTVQAFATRRGTIYVHGCTSRITRKSSRPAAGR
jgi:hypothetical protein